MKCPKCGSEDSTLILDCGVKRIIRAILRNNRYACRRCSVTWLRQRPLGWQKLKKNHKPKGTVREAP